MNNTPVFIEVMEIVDFGDVSESIIFKFSSESEAQKVKDWIHENTNFLGVSSLDNHGYSSSEEAIESIKNTFKDLF